MASAAVATPRVIPPAVKTGRCPLSGCKGKLNPFFINFTEVIFLCSMCTFPLDTEDPQIYVFNSSLVKKKAQKSPSSQTKSEPPAKKRKISNPQTQPQSSSSIPASSVLSPPASSPASSSSSSSSSSTLSIASQPQSSSSSVLPSSMPALSVLSPPASSPALPSQVSRPAPASIPRLPSSIPASMPALSASSPAPALKPASSLPSQVSRPAPIPNKAPVIILDDPLIPNQISNNNSLTHRNNTVNNNFASPVLNKPQDNWNFSPSQADSVMAYHVADPDPKVVKLVKIFQGGWISEEIVNSFFEILTKKYNGLNIKCDFIHSYFLPKLKANFVEGCNWSVVKEMQKKSSEGSVDLIFFPIFIPERRHWILAIMYVNEGKYVFLDSLADEKSSTEHRDLFQSFLENCFPDKDWFFNFPIRKPHQIITNDQSNCGIFICYYAEEISKKKPLHQISKAEISTEIINDYRSQLACRLLCQHSAASSSTSSLSASSMSSAPSAFSPASSTSMSALPSSPSQQRPATTLDLTSDIPDLDAILDPSTTTKTSENPQETWQWIYFLFVLISKENEDTIFAHSTELTCCRLNYTRI